ISKTSLYGLMMLIMSGTAWCSLERQTIKVRLRASIQGTFGARGPCSYPGRFLLGIAALVSVVQSMGQTGLIKFELLPDGTEPPRGMVISNQFAASPGVRFRFRNGSFPQSALVGGTRPNGRPSAFFGWPADTGANTPAPGPSVGTR